MNQKTLDGADLRQYLQSGAPLAYPYQMLPQQMQRIHLGPHYNPHQQQAVPTQTQLLKYPCDACADVFKTFVALQYHYKDCHRFSCIICNQDFPTVVNRDQHFNIAHQVCCKPCGEYFNTDTDLALHNRTNHRFPCTLCSNVYEEETLRNRHVKLVHCFECSVCMEVFDTNDGKDEHFQIVHQQKCDICDCIATSLAGLKLHYQVAHQIACEIEEELERIECNSCVGKFNDMGELYIHYANQHINLCHLCDEDFSSVNALIKHIKSIHKQK